LILCALGDNISGGLEKIMHDFVIWFDQLHAASTSKQVTVVNFDLAAP
jgi:hypothetical protein